MILWKLEHDSLSEVLVQEANHLASPLVKDLPLVNYLWINFLVENYIRGK